VLTLTGGFLFEVGVNETIFIVNEPPEGGYAAEALGHSIFTVAETSRRPWCGSSMVPKHLLLG
jgi:hypothetical protein